WSISARAETDENGFVRIRPEQLEWNIPFPGATPLALVEGDPSKAGIYVLRVQFPPNLFSRPHKHGEDRLIVVLKGTWYMGPGEHFNPAKGGPFPVGSFISPPAGEWHWDGAKDEEVVLKIVGCGPSSTEVFEKAPPMFGPEN